MTDRKPIVQVSGQYAEMPSGDKISISSIATGTPDGTKFVRDDGTLAVPSGGSTPSWQVKTANYTASSGEYIMADTSAGAWTLTLPASPSANDFVYWADYEGTFGVYNLTVGRNGSNINGEAVNYESDLSNEMRCATYIDATQGWRVT